MPDMNLAILTNMVAPYRVPLFKALAQHSQIRSLRVLTCVAREIDREWTVENDCSYTVTRLPGMTLNFKRGSDGRRIIHLRLGILWELIRHRPDRLIIGDASWTSFLAVFCCRLLGIPYLVWNEIIVTTPVRRGLIDRLRRYMVRHARACIASGELARQFLLKLGCTPEKIVIAQNAVDNDYFRRQRELWEPHRERLREELGIAPDAFALLYVGQLISRKRVLELLEASAQVAQKRSLHLIFAGSGPLEMALKARAAELGYTAVSFTGFVDSTRLSQLYVAADGVALVSEDEPWGMVVNEAMLFGKPIIATENVGAAVEFVSEDIGFLIKKDLSELTIFLEKFLHVNFYSPTLIAKVEDFSSKYMANQIYEASLIIN